MGVVSWRVWSLVGYRVRIWGGPLSRVGGWGVVRGWVGGPVGGYNSPRETLGVHLGGLDVARGYDWVRFLED